MRKLLRPFFQPILDLRTNTLSHFEALARIIGEEEKERHVEFIATAEKFGFVYLIDMTIMERVCEILRENPRLRIASNFSVKTIEQEGNMILSTLYRHSDVSPRFIVEITETVPISDHAAVAHFIKGMHHAGVKVALDDFGAGHFTLDTINLLRPDIIKLDGTIVEQVEQGDMRMLTMVQTVASKYGAEIVGERVDNETKLGALRKAGVHYAQGFLIGHPTPAFTHPADESRSFRPLQAIGAGFPAPASP